MIASRSALPGRRRLTRAFAAVAVVAAGVTLTALSAGAASATTTISGPVRLGTAASFGVLGASTVTNTGLSTIGGDVGLSPGSSTTGFPPGTLNSGGVFHTTDTVAAQAQLDNTTAYNVAASLSPTTSGLTDLVGLTLTPGVYSGDDLSLSGNLTLDGSANSVWVFQAANTLITGSGSTITMTGGASSCNVFWQVGSSATLGSASTLVGTVLALASISSTTGTTVQGRLLAQTGAVTLDDTNVVLPSGCGADGTVLSSPTITSGAPTTAVVGRRYAFAVATSGAGTSSPSYSVSSGSVPPGLTLDSTTGMISGTPTTAGTFAVTISASNGIAPPATASYQIRVAALLAETGTTSTWIIPWAVAALGLGALLIVFSRRRRVTRRH
jgi:LPXTG-motif cell wall-anchored protein